MWIILDIAIAYILFIWDFNASLTTKKHKYILDYHGILWVALDCWSIVKYRSADKPIKMIYFQVQDAN